MVEALLFLVYTQELRLNYILISKTLLARLLFKIDS